MLKGKTALITGASRGIGRSTALLFAENNANVIINYNNSYNDAKSLKEEIESKYNIKVFLVKADIGNEDEIKYMFDLIKNEFSSIDILVNNAAICDDSLVASKSKESFNNVVNINLTGTFLVTKYAINYMNNGSIINISSTNAIDSFYPESMEYDASKAGVISLTHNYAKLLSPNIRVNAIAPGWVNTDMNKDLSKEQKLEENKKILLNRFADAKEIAEVALFLASDKSSYINDSIIKVDGGHLY